MNRREFSQTLIGLSAGAVLPELASAKGNIKRQQATPNPSNEKGKIRTVDTHAHVFERGLNLAKVRRYAPDYDATLADYLGMLDRHGITNGVLIQPSFLGTDNSYLLKALHAYPSRLRGVAVVAPETTLEQLRYLAAAGIVGVRLNLVGKPLPDLGSGPYASLLKKVSDLDWHVEVHREAKDLPAIIDPLLKSGVNVVVDHFGRPDPRLGINDPGFRYLLSTASSGRIWVKLSGAYRNGLNGAGDANARASVPLLLAAFGADRLVWGSDWPHTQFERTMDYTTARDQFESWLPDEKTRKLILVDTPARFFRFASADKGGAPA